MTEFAGWVRDQLLEEGLPVSWIVEHCAEEETKEQTIQYVPLRKKGGLSNENLLWLFGRYVEELPEYSVVLVVDATLRQLKINPTSIRAVVLPPNGVSTKSAKETAPPLETDNSTPYW